MKLKHLIIFILPSIVLSHGGHGSAQATKPEGISWQDWHMLEEHNLEEYDAQTFFKLHDLKARGYWDSNDILSIYGLAKDTMIGDGSGMGSHGDHDHEQITKSVKDKVLKTILELVDSNKDGKISSNEWIQFHNTGGELPDFGYGPGHHLDFEDEYEQHHWMKYHQDDDPEVLIKHKEDIEHEMLHHQHEIEESHNEQPEIRQVTNNFLSKIRLHNLKQKYRSK